MRFKTLPWHRYFFELLGTLFLTLLIGLSLAVGGPLMPWMAGATLAALLYLGRHVSGGHYNPAITLAVLIHGHLSLRDAGAYGLAQLLGALGGAALVPALAQDGSFVYTLEPAGSATLVQVLVCELLFSFLLVMVYLHTALSQSHRLSSAYGLALGLTYLVIWYASAGISGAVLNPALGLGPNVLAAAYGPIWIYAVAPLLGGTLAAFVFRWTSPQDPPRPIQGPSPRRRSSAEASETPPAADALPAAEAPPPKKEP